jgi:hypothetical protein
MNEPQPSRLAIWSRFLDSLSKLLGRVAWLIVLIIILASLGRLYLNKPDDSGADTAQKPHGKTRSDAPVSKPIVTPSIPVEALNQGILDALKSARESAESYANKRIDAWIAQLMQRVDSDFLEWYFGYWNQQLIGLKGLYNGLKHSINDSAPTAEEKFTQQVQEEFAKRVLRPEIAQMELESLAQEVVNNYAAALHDQLKDMPARFNLPREDWERHLDNIAAMTSRTEGNREVGLSLKAITVSATAGTLALGKAMMPVVKKVTGQVSGKLAGKAAAKMAAKTGSKVAAKAGGELLGPIVAIGIIAWDYWDHTKTKEHGKPVLRQNIADYFAQLKQSLLHDNESGLITAITRIESSLGESLKTNQ